MQGRKHQRHRQDGFSLLELLIVLGILSLLAGIGAGGSRGVRQWLAVNETRSLFMELENACQLYRMEQGGWPSALAGGETDLNEAGSGWRTQLASYMERRVLDQTLEDGFGNTRIYLILDEDGDHWIKSEQFETLDAAMVPSRIWSRVAVYSLDAEGHLAGANWGYDET